MKFVWLFNVAGMLALLGLLVVRRNYRTHPYFFSYILVALTQGAVLSVVYKYSGYSSLVSWQVGWGSQAVVLAARALVIVELCRHVLGRFRGIWVLARPLLLSCAAVVAMLYGLIARFQDWRLAPVSAEMGVELAVALVIVVLLLLTRYYRVSPEFSDRLLGAGLWFYSCFVVINDVFLERWLNRYASLWVVLPMSAYAVTLLTWFYAFLKRPSHATQNSPALLDQSVYAAISPHINSRLRLLNEQVANLTAMEAPPR